VNRYLPGAISAPWQRLAIAGCVGVLAISGCTREPGTDHSTSPSPSPPAQAAGTGDTPTAGGAASPAGAAASAEPSPPATAPPVASTSLAEPGTAAINTPQAAATAVETYFALLAAGRTRDAEALWGNPAQAAAFRREFAALGKYSAKVGTPGGIEGAAGSMYVTIPLRFIPAASAPNPRPRMGEVVVRRVNDVPGSTAAQRRWHIERIDVAMTPK